MAPLPSLVPLPPQRTAPASLNTSPFWLGSSREAAYPLFLPGIVERHAVLVERADGYWILPGSGPTTVNGASIGSGVLLRHGDVIRLAPGGEFRFESGEAPAAPPPEAIVESVPVQRSNRRKPRRMAARLPRPFIIAASMIPTSPLGSRVTEVGDASPYCQVVTCPRALLLVSTRPSPS